MIEAILEYWEITKMSLLWVKKHCKGYLMLIAIWTGAVTIYYNIDEIRCFISSKISNYKKHKVKFNDEEES